LKYHWDEKIAYKQPTLLLRLLSHFYRGLLITGDWQGFLSHSQVYAREKLLLQMVARFPMLKPEWQALQLEAKVMTTRLASIQQGQPSAANEWEGLIDSFNALTAPADREGCINAQEHCAFLAMGLIEAGHYPLAIQLLGRWVDRRSEKRVMQAPAVNELLRIAAIASLADPDLLESALRAAQNRLHSTGNTIPEKQVACFELFRRWLASGALYRSASNPHWQQFRSGLDALAPQPHFLQPEFTLRVWAGLPVGLSRKPAGSDSSAVSD
jgi:hypothetical protein